MRRRRGLTQAEVAQRTGVTPGPDLGHRARQARRDRTADPRLYVEALSGRLEIIAGFGDERLAIAEPGTKQPEHYPLTA